jgi:hypothetical protein
LGTFDAIPSIIEQGIFGAKTGKLFSRTGNFALNPDNAGDQLRRYDQTDFSLVVESRAPPPKLVKMQIYRAGRKSPTECSSVLYETVEEANRAGKEALKQLLTEFPA